MRQLTTSELARRFMARFARAAREPVNVYFTGGVTAVLHGWRDTTIDIDLKIVPDPDEVMRAIPQLKEDLHVNIELASPDQFIPELPGWRERCIHIATEGNISYFHYDPYAQALAKIERGHRQDAEDVARMLSTGLVERDLLLDLFGRIEDDLYRYPAIDSAAFREAVEAIVRT